MILPITLFNGEGGINVVDISAILPDTLRPKTSSTIYTTLFPAGIDVEGKADELCALWYVYLEEYHAAGVVDDTEPEEEHDVVAFRPPPLPANDC